MWASLICEGVCNEGRVQEVDLLIRETRGNLDHANATLVATTQTRLHQMIRDLTYTWHEVHGTRATCETCGYLRQWGRHWSDGEIDGRRPAESAFRP